MSIGYACKTVGVPNTEMKSCLLKNAGPVKLTGLIAHNLDALETIIHYNIKNSIRLFRISSDLIPFGSSPVNTLPWWELFSARFETLGQMIQSSGMRVSMHPGQYTVLNSPKKEVVANAMDDLCYHTRVLDSLGVGPGHKIVLHIGGIYSDKKLAIKRFISHYAQLDDAVKRRLVVENDDRSYHIGDVLEIGMTLQAPVIFDYLHNRVKPCEEPVSEIAWINACRKTWHEKDGPQKIHYSQQEAGKKPGYHSQTVRIDAFMDFYHSVAREDLDIMLEVKDKNLSAVKCINCTSPDRNIKALELEWARYKYSILEHAPMDYWRIKELLRSNKNQYAPRSFYHTLEAALEKPKVTGNSVLALQQVWDHFFQPIASEAEKKNFIKSVKAFRQNQTTVHTVKNSLWKMAIKYQQTHLLHSYYFVL